MKKIYNFIIFTTIYLTSSSVFALTLEDALIHSYHFNPELQAERSNLKATIIIRITNYVTKGSDFSWALFFCI